jgi:hypothetical protein
MGWERRARGGQCYLYRSLRAGGKVIHHYLGRGEQAARAARELETAKVIRLAERKAILDEEERTGDAHRLMLELNHRCETLLEAILLGEGLHRQNYGAWRRRRGIPKN